MNNIVSSQICSFSRCLPVVANVHELDEGRLRLPGHPILCRRHRLHLDYDLGFGKLYFMSMVKTLLSHSEGRLSLSTTLYTLLSTKIGEL